MAEPTLVYILDPYSVLPTALVTLLWKYSSNCATRWKSELCYISEKTGCCQRLLHYPPLFSWPSCSSPSLHTFRPQLHRQVHLSLILEHVPLLFKSSEINVPHSPIHQFLARACDLPSRRSPSPGRFLLSISLFPLWPHFPFWALYPKVSCVSSLNPGSL